MMPGPGKHAQISMAMGNDKVTNKIDLRVQQTNKTPFHPITIVTQSAPHCLSV